MSGKRRRCNPHISGPETGILSELAQEDIPISMRIHFLAWLLLAAAESCHEPWRTGWDFNDWGCPMY